MKKMRCILQPGAMKRWEIERMQRHSMKNLGRCRIDFRSFERVGLGFRFQVSGVSQAAVGEAASLIEKRNGINTRVEKDQPELDKY